MAARHHCDELLTELNHQRDGLTRELRALSVQLDEFEWRLERRSERAPHLDAEALRRRIHVLARRLQEIDDRAFGLKYAAVGESYWPAARGRS